MGNMDVFSSVTTFAITFMTLLMLAGAAWLMDAKAPMGRLVRGFFVGIAVEFLSTWIESASGIENVFSASMAVFIILSILVGSLVFLLLTASRLIDIKLPEPNIIWGVLILGIAPVICFTFIWPDGNKTAMIRNVYPLIGFCAISIGLWSKIIQRNNLGFIMAATLTSAVSALYAVRLLIKPDFLDVWYVAAGFYLLLAISIFMIKSDILSGKLLDYENKIKSYDKRMTDIIMTSPFPIIIARLSDDRLLLANNNAAKLFGIFNHDIEKYKFKDLFADINHRQALNERLEQEKEVRDFEILVKSPSNNTPFWLLTSANIIDYNYDIAIYAAFQDITSRKNSEIMLKNQASRDPLTALYNRRYFEDEVKVKISQAGEKKESFSVLMIDADHFKRVNDTYGHKTGDKVLIELAHTCEKALREEDIVARYGGEEFVIFLAQTDAETARIVADRLREKIAGIVVLSEDGQPIRFTVSIGISSSDISDNIDVLIKTADEALYRAKEGGRNRSEIFTVKDLKQFRAGKKKTDKKDAYRHPIFDKEEVEEISLLDGAVESGLIDDKSKIEEK